MKYQKGFAPVILILLIVLGLGAVGGGYMIYRDKQQLKKFNAQIENLENEPEDNKKTTVSLAVQAGLPSVVEAKRQAIYKAAVSRDLIKLKAETKSQVESDPESISFYTIDAQGKNYQGLSGFTEMIEYEKTISLFDLYLALLESPYVVTGNLYTWPAVAPKDGRDWTVSDVAYLKKFLSDRQIELLKGYYYTYPKITITSDGKWVNHSFFND